MSRFSHDHPVGRWIAVFAGIVFLWHGATTAAPLTDHERELGGVATPPDAPQSGWNPGLDAQLALALSWSLFQDPDMKQTYGGVPGVGLQIDFATSRESAVYLAAGFGRGRGDPYYDSAGFHDPDAVELQFLPLELGMRTHLAGHAQVGVNVGFGLQLVHVWETSPTLDTFSLTTANVRHAGWLTGFRLSFGPEWRSANRRRALGLSVGIGGSKGFLQGGHGRHDIDLSGIQGQIYHAIKL